jgi:1,2-dihydroxy-3-keto-5-methylthiopentene dioxygenase
MSRLTIYRDDSPLVAELDTTEESRIQQALARINVRFERWAAQRLLSVTDQDADILAAYRPEIRRLEQAQAFQSVDVLRCLPDHPQKEQLRAKFLSEHTHDDDEVRFFVEGAAMFYLHAAQRVHMVLCERNDLISVPAGMRHWFDMGPDPHFTVIRLFTTPDGWVARFTGDSIAARFPAFARQAA